jgi:hypothetical protein
MGSFIGPGRWFNTTAGIHILISLPKDLQYDIKNYHNIVNERWAYSFQEPDDHEMKKSMVVPKYQLTHHKEIQTKKMHRSANAIFRCLSQRRAREKSYTKWFMRVEAQLDAEIDASDDPDWVYEQTGIYDNRPKGDAEWFIRKPPRMKYSPAEIVACIGYSSIDILLPKVLHTIIAEYVADEKDYLVSDGNLRSEQVKESLSLCKMQQCLAINYGHWYNVNEMRQ